MTFPAVGRPDEPEESPRPPDPAAKPTRFRHVRVEPLSLQDVCPGKGASPMRGCTSSGPGFWSRGTVCAAVVTALALMATPDWAQPAPGPETIQQPMAPYDPPARVGRLARIS